MPENFATQYDQLIFTPKPTHILHGKPVEVQYDITLPGRTSGAFVPATLRWDIPYRKVVRIQKITEEIILNSEDVRKRLLNMAYPNVKKRCEKLMADDSDKCFLNLEEKFKEILSKKDQFALCDSIYSSLYNTLCRAVAEQDSTICDEMAFHMDCRGYLVVNLCDRLTGKDFDNCLMEKSIQHSAYIGCLIIEDGDLENKCMARVTGKEQYCKDIRNTSRREKCLALFKKPEQAAQPAQPAAPAGPVNTDVNGYKLWADFNAKVWEEIHSCNTRMCQPSTTNCATWCWGVGGHFDGALYRDYFIHLHPAYLPLANTIADALLEGQKKCDDEMIAAGRQDQKRFDRYDKRVKDFNDKGAAALDEAYLVTCQAWCGEQGKTGKPEGSPPVCACK